MSNTRVTRAVSRTAAGAQASDPKSLYTPQQKEFWSSADEFEYIRPGLNITVNSIKIRRGPQRRRGPVVHRRTRPAARPRTARSRRGVHHELHPGVVGPERAQLHVVHDPEADQLDQRELRPQARPTSGGTWTDVDIGHSTYKFKTALPAGYDPTATTTLGIYSTRDHGRHPRQELLRQRRARLRPDSGGARVTQAWDDPDNSSCNTCHNPLSAHGGSRQDVKLCVLCHSPQTTDPDTGNTVDFKVMVHKIHMGENLPSVAGGESHGSSAFSDIHGGDFSTSCSRRTSATARPATARPTRASRTTRRRPSTGSRTRRGRRASRATTTSISRPARTIPPARRPTTALRDLPHAHERRRVERRGHRTPTRFRSSRRSSRA